MMSVQTQLYWFQKAGFTASFIHDKIKYIPVLTESWKIVCNKSIDPDIQFNSYTEVDDEIMFVEYLDHLEIINTVITTKTQVDKDDNNDRFRT